MKIYHTETQADYDALMVELKAKGIETIPKERWKNHRHEIVVFVHAIDKNHNSSRNDTTYSDVTWSLYKYPDTPITKYKAKADDKMRFTKENVYRLFGDYRRNKNGIHRLDNLESVIMDLDDTPEKVVVPKFVAEFYDSMRDNILSEKFKAFEITTREDVSKWYMDFKGRHNNNRANAQEIIAKMDLYGYEIEKEPQYIVSIMDLGIDRIILMKNKLGYSFELESENDGHWEVHFTEQQIKEYDKRYWAFATLIEEEEE